jgi:hypothetical protein
MGTRWETHRSVDALCVKLLEGMSVDQDESEVDDKVCGKKDGLECSASRIKIVLIHPVIFIIDATTVVTVFLRWTVQKWVGEKPQVAKN